MKLSILSCPWNCHLQRKRGSPALNSSAESLCNSRMSLCILCQIILSGIPLSSFLSIFLIIWWAQHIRRLACGKTTLTAAEILLAPSDSMNDGLKGTCVSHSVAHLTCSKSQAYVSLSSAELKASIAR